MSHPPSVRAGRLTVRLAVPVVASALALAACGNDEQERTSPSPSVSLPTQSVTAPEGVTLTEPGAELSFGDAATVGFAPNADRSTALELTVTRVLRGRITDLAAYDLDAKAKVSRPYYVRVKVRNIGEGQIGRSAIPLWGLGADDTLIGASGFTNSFARCSSGPLPTSFGGGRTTSTCLMFLVPQGGSLVGVSYRPVMADEPIVWKGKIAAPVTKHKARNQRQKKKDKP